MSRRHWILMAAAVVAMAQGCGKDEPQDELDSLVIGKVGDYVITARDVDLRIRNEYEWLADEFRTATEQQIRQILQRDMDALCLVAEAERVGFPDTSANYRHKMEEGRRNTIRRLYSEEVLLERARPTEEELRAEYEANLERWKQPERRVARHILVKTRAEAEEAMSFVTQGEPFAETAKRMTLDDTSRINGGSVGFVERGKPVRGIGPLPEFVDAVFDLDVREMRIIKTSMGWHLIRLERMFEEGYTPFDEAKKELEERLLKQRSVTQLQNTLTQLRVRYGARLYDENLTKYFQMRRRQPEEQLFARAQAEGDPQQRIEVYEEFLKQFPQSTHACEAQFMIAFTFAEELGDAQKARVRLRDYLADCEGDDLYESARFMMDELSK